MTCDRGKLCGQLELLVNELQPGIREKMMVEKRMEISDPRKNVIPTTGHTYTKPLLSLNIKMSSPQQATPILSLCYPSTLKCHPHNRPHLY